MNCSETSESKFLDHLLFTLRFGWFCTGLLSNSLCNCLSEFSL